MILNMIGGGAGGATLDIVWSATQPTGVANRLWIVNNESVGTVTLDYTAPSTPESGDVYIELDCASEAIIQTGNDTQVIMLPLGLAYQYDGSAWVALDGAAYLGDSWVAFSTDIPDGDTITPVNDTNTWLRCAGINPSMEGNPTLSQVLASATMCATLMTSANAINYLIRSTTIQASVFGSATAMTALDNSSPYTSVQMTGNSAPSGYTASAINEYAAGFEAYRATRADSYWASTVGNAATTTGYWVKITLPQAVWPYRIEGAPHNSQNACTVRMEGSNDGTNWTAISSAVSRSINDLTTTAFSLSGSGQYQYYRAYFVSVTGANTGYDGMKALKVYGKTREVA